MDDGFRLTDSIDDIEGMDLGNLGSFHLTGMGYEGPIPI